MKDKKFHTVQDFLADASFRAWVNGAGGEHQDYWTDWLRRHPEQEQEFRLAVLVQEGLPFQFVEQPVAPEMVGEELARLEAKIKENATRKPREDGAKVRNLPRRGSSRVLGIVASIAILAVLSFFVWDWAHDPLIEHRTPYGQQLSVVLPDSTVIELNANSSISYHESNPRKVWLDGEAFFEVTKKPATGANFLVITNDLTVEVLGTAFNVVEKGNQTEVVLEEGSVKLNLNRDFAPEMYMQPGELVAFSATSGAEAKKERVQPNSVSSWKEGMLQFEDVALSDVMQRIEEIYGWRAEYANAALTKRKISTPLPADDLDSALALLSKAIGIEIEKVPEENLLVLK